MSEGGREERELLEMEGARKARIMIRKHGSLATTCTTSHSLPSVSSFFQLCVNKQAR